MNKRNMETLTPSGSPSFSFPLVQSSARAHTHTWIKQAAWTMFYKESLFRGSITCKCCPPVFSEDKLIGQYQKCLREVVIMHFCAKKGGKRCTFNFTSLIQLKKKKQKHLWKKSNWSSPQHYLRCITSCWAFSGWDIAYVCFWRKLGYLFYF